MAIGSVSCVISEIFLFLGIKNGIMGPVLAIFSFNHILVTCISWVKDHLALNTLQILGIAISFLGVIIISLGSAVMQYTRKLFTHTNKRDQQAATELQ